jgi:hypothetical protein
LEDENGVNPHGQVRPGEDGQKWNKDVSDRTEDKQRDKRVPDSHSPYKDREDSELDDKCDHSVDGHKGADVVHRVA